ncbi:GNAT family N-acetyltransferase [Methylovirgula sp. 4M-Z18]|uniref:GNAT family N-acetyltransferase n=1 Tax=Methylovirgula sp. 4M-Z18 TaxID=2293567 RepID=UPI000E2FA7E5|nr:GNAT family N-acetyltransferase [Methylovirgula sp. 4M-Z18]RFB79134.1 GNAT family N-acetyltransferase [Methylovirgula sp. 4M-Z18]
MLNIRPFAASDIDALAALIAEMQDHYGVFCPPLPQIANGLRRLPDGVEILMAETDSMIGFAAFATVFPGPGIRAGLFLKELYVAKAARGTGVGRALMRALAALALERELGRIDWTADAKDHALNTFYESLGARAMPEKVFFRLASDDLAACAAQSHLVSTKAE